MTIDVPLEQQQQLASDFVEGLLSHFDIGAVVDCVQLDEQTLELRVTGEDLGLLIGPRGATLGALQDLTRTVVQRRSGGRTARIMLDVAGYRQKRKAALERFTRQIADKVLATGREEVLEPMIPPDRKVVHDTINAIPGVVTRSEGEEPRRSVVVVPGGEAN